MNRGGRLAGGSFPLPIWGLLQAALPFLGIALIVSAFKPSEPIVHVGTKIDNLTIYVAPGTPKEVIEHELADLSRPARPMARRTSAMTAHFRTPALWMSECGEDGPVLTTLKEYRER